MERRSAPPSVGVGSPREDLIARVEFVEATLDSIEEGIVACDADGNLVLFNDATRRFHGLPAQPVPQDLLAEHYDLYDETGDRLLTVDEIPLLRALAGEEVAEAGMVIQPRHGERRRLVATGRQVRDEDGRLLGAVVAMHDVTRRLEAEESAARLRAEAARQRDELLAGVSHDMQTPLASILGFTQLLDDDLELLIASGQVDEVTRAMRRQADHLQALVGQFLDYTRLSTTATLELHRAEMDLAGMLAELVDTHACADRLTLAVDGPLVLLGDVVRLRRVVGNLLSNAMRYSDGQIEVHAHSTGPDVTVTVRDHGPGLGDDPDALFGRFARGDTDSDVDGTGLGLYVSRAIANAHGGSLVGSDAAGGGACFVLTLPAGLDTAGRDDRDERESGDYSPSTHTEVAA